MNWSLSTLSTQPNNSSLLTGGEISGNSLSSSLLTSQGVNTNSQNDLGTLLKRLSEQEFMIKQLHQQIDINRTINAVLSDGLNALPPLSSCSSPPNTMLNNPSVPFESCLLSTPTLTSTSTGTTTAMTNDYYSSNTNTTNHSVNEPMYQGNSITPQNQHGHNYHHSQQSFQTTPAFNFDWSIPQTVPSTNPQDLHPQNTMDNYGTADTAPKQSLDISSWYTMPPAKDEVVVAPTSRQRPNGLARSNFSSPADLHRSDDFPRGINHDSVNYIPPAQSLASYDPTTGPTTASASLFHSATSSTTSSTSPSTVSSTSQSKKSLSSNFSCPPVAPTKTGAYVSPIFNGTTTYPTAATSISSMATTSAPATPSIYQWGSTSDASNTSYLRGQTSSTITPPKYVSRKDRPYHPRPSSLNDCANSFEPTTRLSLHNTPTTVRSGLAMTASIPILPPPTTTMPNTSANTLPCPCADCAAMTVASVPTHQSTQSTTTTAYTSPILRPQRGGSATSLSSVQATPILPRDGNREGNYNKMPPQFSLFYDDNSYSRYGPTQTPSSSSITTASNSSASPINNPKVTVDMIKEYMVSQQLTVDEVNSIYKIIAKTLGIQSMQRSNSSNGNNKYHATKGMGMGMSMGMGMGMDWEGFDMGEEDEEPSEVSNATEAKLWPKGQHLLKHFLYVLPSHGWSSSRNNNKSLLAMYNDKDVPACNGPCCVKGQAHNINEGNDCLAHLSKRGRRRARKRALERMVKLLNNHYLKPNLVSLIEG